MKKLLFRSCIELTNHRLSSSVLRKFSRSKISKPFIKPFSTTFNLNESEMNRSLNEFVNLHDLFTRELKSGVRPIDTEEDAFVSPVDGVVAHFGKLEEKTYFHVKGQTYTIEEMLGSKEASQPYLDGHYFILYLSPSHYHRIHSPVDGIIKKQWVLGGRSYPVNDLGLRYGKKPLSKNYRLITEMNVNAKHVALVKVGAMNVNTIEVTHKNNNVNKGDEVGYFSFGSTVVLLCEKGLILDITTKEHVDVQMGQRIAIMSDDKAQNL
ncbi:phosphatidylserine decarboxylase [Halalkalibacter alkalisediminis]|uniref:Phosphatidylserine decarboxylase proenzyme n=1 Tax=Halalkalibacter alkalisediminis TaxID=935616 RepID=A0ABV6NB31_9BACI|nr:phosphatidylserine decarboxylase [Halalkalibacter alkalisediminis]